MAARWMPLVGCVAAVALGGGCGEQVRLVGGGTVGVEVVGEEVAWEATTLGLYPLPDGYQGFALEDWYGAHAAFSREAGTQRYTVSVVGELPEWFAAPSGCPGEARAFTLLMRISDRDAVRREPVPLDAFERADLWLEVASSPGAASPLLVGELELADVLVRAESRRDGVLEIPEVRWSCEATGEVVGTSELRVAWDFAVSDSVPIVAD